MQIPKPTAADMDRFRACVPPDPRVDVRPMFGNLGAYVNGNMFLGLFGADIGVKLAPSDAAALLAVDGAGPFGPPERPMGGYVTVPSHLVGTPEGDRWIDLGLRYVDGFPPKVRTR